MKVAIGFSLSVLQVRMRDWWEHLELVTVLLALWEYSLNTPTEYTAPAKSWAYCRVDQKNVDFKITS